MLCAFSLESGPNLLQLRNIVKTIKFAFIPSARTKAARIM